MLNNRGRLIRSCSDADAQKSLQKYTVASTECGSFGPVLHVLWKRRRKTRKPQAYVVKQIQLGRFTSSFRQEIVNEVRAVASLHHPQLVATRQVKLTPQLMYIFTVACTGGNLHTRFPYTEIQAKDILKQILQALIYIHKKGYIHKGLTYEKVLFQSPRSYKVKLIGFGLSGHHNKPPGQSGQLQTPTSFLRSAAPEVFLGILTKRCDMWSLGVVAFELLGAKKPFVDASITSLITSIADAKYKFDEDMWQSRTFPAKRFCCELMCKVPESRLSAAQALQHYWMTHDEEVEKPPTDLRSVRPTTLLSSSPPMDRIVRALVDRKEFILEQQELMNHFKSLDIRGLGSVTIYSFKFTLKKVVGETYYNAALKEIKLHALNVCYTDFLATAVHQFLLAREQSLCASLDALDTTSSRVLPCSFVKEVLAAEFTDTIASSIMLRISPNSDREVSFDSVFLALRSEMQKITDRQLPEHDRSVQSSLVLL